LIRLRLAAGLVGLAAIAASCSVGPASLNAKPADLYSIMPTQSDVRALMGDSNWWAGAPSFEVRPLDAETTPVEVKFAVAQSFIRLGTAEELIARYTVYDKTSTATTVMSSYQTGFGTSPSSPKVGDQVLYYGGAGAGGAPYLYRTYVRVGQIVLSLFWLRKDLGVKVEALAKNAKLFANGLRDLNKVHATPQPVDKKYLPPAGRDITFLGAANLPTEAIAAMTLTPLADYTVSILHQAGITSFPYGDYALNNDTHMEVQTVLLVFPNPVDAAALAKGYGGVTPDADGIYSNYVPVSGSPAAGFYEYLFAADRYVGIIFCKSSIDGEAASRECEDPSRTTALAWKIALSSA
jgi:hypothetical protein